MASPEPELSTYVCPLMLRGSLASLCLFLPILPTASGLKSTWGEGHHLGGLFSHHLHLFPRKANLWKSYSKAECRNACCGPVTVSAHRSSGRERWFPGPGEWGWTTLVLYLEKEEEEAER